MDEPRVHRIRAILKNVPLAIDCVSESARLAGCDERTVMQIQVAVDEACANVVQHAYHGTEPGDMEISCSYERGCFVVRVRDWGESFDPNGVATPDVDAPLEERELGGLGIFLIQQYMDEAHFSTDPHLGNELVMVKRCQLADQDS